MSPVSIPFVGSGQFVPERVWSCPVHDDDVTYRGDYEDYEDAWEVEGEVCLDCATGHWRDKKDADGNVVMRELGQWEAALFTHAQSFFAPPDPLFLKALSSPRSDARIVWFEDAPMPRIESAA